jgi:hypothetical protein
MCWSKEEREEWERLQREREEQHLLVSALDTDAEPAVQPEAEVEEREGELIRV